MSFPPTLGLGTFAFITLAVVLAAAILTPTWIYARRLGWETVTYLSVTVLSALLGAIFWQITRNLEHFAGIICVAGFILMTVAAKGLFLGFIEFGVLRALGLSQVGAIARTTYYEALLQPFTSIILLFGLCSIGVAAKLGFFTYNEDFKMYRDVASSFVFLFALPVMVFAATRVIDEEIENRTMLTLMSKPVSRTQVVLGKYLGVFLLVVACVGILGLMAATCGYMRYYDDMRIDYNLAQNNPAGIARLELDNVKALLALLPSLVLTFLQVATLAAISVAVSTRFGLAINVTVVVLIYLAASLAHYVGQVPELPVVVRAVINFFAHILPSLNNLDLNQRLIFSNYILNDSDWAPSMPTYGMIWQYVGVAVLYSLFYIAAILSFGVALFRTRELT